MLKFAENVKPRSCMKSHTDEANAINLMKILSFGENDLKNGRVYSNEDVEREINSILAE